MPDEQSLDFGAELAQAREQRQPGVGLVAGKGEQVHRIIIAQQPAGRELAVGSAHLLGRAQFVKVHGHHAGADTKTPAVAVRCRRPDAGIGQRFFGRGQREAVGARGVLENFWMADDGGGIEAPDLATDADGKAAGIKILDGAEPAAAGRSAM